MEALTPTINALCATGHVAKPYLLSATSLSTVVAGSRYDSHRPSMTREEIVSIGLRYQKRFGNIEQVGHPEIIFDPRFGELMEIALKSGEPLTRATVAKIFPEIVGDI
jgi:hypothetical protein